MSEEGFSLAAQIKTCEVKAWSEGGITMFPNRGMKREQCKHALAPSWTLKVAASWKRGKAEADSVFLFNFVLFQHPREDQVSDILILPVA